MKYWLENLPDNNNNNNHNNNDNNNEKYKNMIKIITI